jgi:hypothetical protein
MSPFIVFLMIFGFGFVLYLVAAAVVLSVDDKLEAWWKRRKLRKGALMKRALLLTVLICVPLLADTTYNVNGCSFTLSSHPTFGQKAKMLYCIVFYGD